MLGKFETECPLCYDVNCFSYNDETKIIKCKSCGEIYSDIEFIINSLGVIVDSKLKRVSEALTY